MQHVMIDVYGCDATLLANKSFLHSVLHDYPDVIDMERVSEVVLRDIKTSEPLDDGMSGFVIIATSHVSLHAWPPYGMVNLDIFSCEPFDIETVVNFARSRFESENIEVHSVERATHSPRLTYLERGSNSLHPERQRAHVGV